MANESIHIQKGISIGHIVTTIGLVIGGFTFVYDLREQLAIADIKIESMEARLERAAIRTDAQFEDIMNVVYRLETKIDKLVIDWAKQGEK